MHHLRTTTLARTFGAAVPLVAVRHSALLSSECKDESNSPDYYRTVHAHGIRMPVSATRQDDHRKNSLHQQQFKQAPLRPTAHAKYIIVGDGVAGRAAAETLRMEGVPKSCVLTLTGKGGAETRAAAIDTRRNLVICEDGETVIRFDRCLIACGSEPAGAGSDAKKAGGKRSLGRDDDGEERPAGLYGRGGGAARAPALSQRGPGGLSPRRVSRPARGGGGVVLVRRVFGGRRRRRRPAGGDGGIQGAKTGRAGAPT